MMRMRVMRRPLWTLCLILPLVLLLLLARSFESFDYAMPFGSLNERLDTIILDVQQLRHDYHKDMWTFTYDFKGYREAQDRCYQEVICPVDRDVPIHTHSFSFTFTVVDMPSTIFDLLLAFLCFCQFSCLCVFWLGLWALVIIWDCFSFCKFYGCWSLWFMIFWIYGL